MSNNRNSLEEFKKFNLELEKHLGNVSFDSLANLGFSGKSSSDEDFLMLLVNNVSDLKTDFALLRRSLSDNIESLLVRKINEERSIYVKQFSDANANLFLNLKSSLSDSILQIGEELSEIKKEFTSAISSEQQSVLNMQSVFEDISFLKTQIGEVLKFRDSLKADLRVFSSEVRELKVMIKNQENIDAKDDIKRSVLLLNKKVDKVIESLEDKSKIVGEVKLLKSSNVQGKLDVSSNVKVLQKEDDISLGYDSLLGKSGPEYLDSEQISRIDTKDNIKRLLSVNDKLRRLESLR